MEKEEREKNRVKGETVVPGPRPPKKREAERKAAIRQGFREKKPKVDKSISKPQEASTTASEQPWTLLSASAGRFLDHDPIFRKDVIGSEFVITANTREVQIISLDTSLVVRSLPAPEDTSVVAFDKSESSYNSTNLRVAYSDGTFRDWNWTDGSHATAKSKAQGRVRALTVVDGGSKAGDVTIYTSSEGKRSHIAVGGQNVYGVRVPLPSIKVLGRAAYIVSYSKSRLVLGKRNFEAKDNIEYVWTELPVDADITCFDARVSKAAQTDRRAKPVEQLSITLGNRHGHVQLYEDVLPLFSNEKTSLSPRILHWHREAVSSVKFSRDGNYLISGGKETVLVIWQLSTGKQQFLPHLTSEIERIVVNEAGDRYALQMGDNSIMVLSTSELRPIANLAGLQMPVAQVGDSKHGATPVMPSVAAVLHPSKPNELLLPVPSSQPKTLSDVSSRPFVQTFDLATSRHISRQAFTRNNVTDFNVGPDRNPLASPDVGLIAISEDGHWLATVDDWMPPAKDVNYLADTDAAVAKERKKRREVYLKIWNWNEDLALWTLTTRVDSPHPRADGQVWGAGAVLALVSSPASNSFATMGEDGAVKLWTPKIRMRSGVPLKDEQGNDLIEWRCKKSIELENAGSRADSPMQVNKAEIICQGYLAFTADGSMLAAAQTTSDTSNDPTIHLINAFTGTVMAQKHNIAGPGLKQIAFLGQSLIILGRTFLRTYNLVRDELAPSIRLQKSDYTVVGDVHLAVDPEDDCFAVGVPGLPEEHAALKIYKPKGNRCVAEIMLEAKNPVVALLSGKGRKGFVALFSDGTVRSLQPNSLLAKGVVTGNAVIEDVTAPTVAQVDAGAMVPFDADEEMADAGAVPGKGTMLMEGDYEDDGPVVRPEQLAGLFDVGQSFALPSVRDMFRGVVGLFGRPRRNQDVEVAA